MNAQWNLERIYCDFSDPAFASDMNVLQEAAEGFRAFAGCARRRGQILNQREL